MKRPVIAITIDSSDAKADHYDSPNSSSAAVEHAGGLPVLLPYHTDVSLVSQYVDLIDGIVFSGGDDLDPAGDDLINLLSRIPSD